MKKLSSSAALLALLMSGAALAGPVSEYEAAFSEVYASYRTALFVTNSGDAAKSSGDAAKSRLALQAFDDKWAALMSRYAASPPPQYADDPLWSQTLMDVDRSLELAQSDAADGQLPASHEALEAVRDAIGALHARNSIETFSDRMNAYHAEMEHVLALDMTQLDPAMARTLLERAAVLSYLADDVLLVPPVGVDANIPEFASLASAFKASVDQFLAAARSDDADALRSAASGLKVPYSKFFLMFG